MTSMLKQRLVGAAVLIALGVIFIPMLLTGEGDFMSGEMESNVPPKPMYEIKAPKVVPMDQSAGKTSELVVEPVPAEASASPVIEIKTTEQDKLADASAGGATQKPEAAKSEEPEPEEPKTNESSEVASDSKAKPPVSDPAISKPKVAPAPVAVKKPAAKKPIVSGWVVQLGSFSVQKNALKLRDRLRKKGHASFVEEYNRNGKTSYRVRVGPELTRELADALKQKLKAETKIDGLVITFPGK